MRHLPLPSLLGREARRELLTLPYPPDRSGGTFDANPFSYEARAQHFSKPLSEPWDWETDRIRGVNLGG